MRFLLGAACWIKGQFTKKKLKKEVVKMKNKRTLANMEVLIFNPENQTMEAQKGVEIYADQIETSNGLLDLKDATRYVDEWNAKIYYIFNIDLPAKVEAENLKKLRRAVTLTRIFDYDVRKPMDIFKLMPYIIIIALVVFR